MTFIVKVPGVNNFENETGCAKTGNEILKYLKKISVNEQKKLINFELLDFEEIHLDNSNLELTNKLIYKNAFEIFETKSKTIFLGGDHSISFSLVKSFLEYCYQQKKIPCLIVFDSYPNCKSEGFGESKKKYFPTNEEWLGEIIKQGFPTENLILVGIRNYNLEELKFLSEKKIKQININSIEEDIDNIADTLMEFCNGKETYLSLDLSVADEVFAPASTFSDSGGMTSRQLIYIFQRLSKIKTLRAMDLVEINSEKDKRFNDITLKLGAKILSEVL